MSKKIYKIMSLGLCICIVFTFTGCTYRDEKIVISSNIRDELIAQKEDVLSLMQKASDYLNSNKFNEAKITFEQLIEKHKQDSNIYIQIKDKYIDLKRYDDAYYFIKLAIDNNIEVEEMKNILQDIKSNFETINISKEVVQYEKVSLPESVETTINNVKTDIDIVWESDVNTSTPGTYTIKGTSSEYNHEVIFNLTVKELTKENKFGQIRQFYKEDGFYYIVFDEAEGRYVGEEAKQKLIEDGQSSYLQDYYVINNDKSTVTYKVDPNCEIKAHSFVEDKVECKGITNITLEEWRIPNYYGCYWIHIENNIITNCIIDTEVDYYD